MGRSWAPALLIGALVTAALLGTYLHGSGIFYTAALHLERFYFGIFRLPAGQELSFVLPLQYASYTLLAFVSAWICIDLRSWLARIAYVSGAVFLITLVSPVLAFCGVLFEPFSSALGIVLAGAVGMGYASFTGAAQSQEKMRYFVGRVSNAEFQRLISAKVPPPLRGKREITVLTCHVLNYPDLIGHLEAEDVEKMGSSFMRAAAEFLISKGAYLDTGNAQGVRVFFGMLDDDDTHATKACQAALELRQRLMNLEQEMQSRWHRKPVFGVALSTGPMSLGLFGFADSQFYSAVGESVEFCRRLCGVNLIYGSHVLISARTYLLAKDVIEARPMEMVYAPKLHQISEVYELVEEKGKLSEEEVQARDAFWQGVVSLRKGAYKEAVMQLKMAQVPSKDDAPLKYFLDRAEAGLQGDMTHADGKAHARHVRVLTSN